MIVSAADLKLLVGANTLAVSFSVLVFLFAHAVCAPTGHQRRFRGLVLLCEQPRLYRAPDRPITKC